MSKEKFEKRILVVDDEPPMRDVLGTILIKEGYSVNTASNGIKALEILEKNTDYIGIITDRDMPNMDGIELIKELERTDKKYPIILVSGHLPSDVCVEIGRSYSGPINFLQKPFGYKDFLSKVKETFEKDK